MHSMDGSTYDDRSGVTAAIFPFPAFERLQEASAAGPVQPVRAQAGWRRERADQGPGRARAGRVRLWRLLSRARRVAGSRPPDRCGRRSRRRRAGRGPEPGLLRAALRRCRQRHRAADSDQQRAVHRDRRDARQGSSASIRRPRRRCISPCTPAASSLRPRGRARVSATRTTTGSR